MPSLSFNLSSYLDSSQIQVSSGEVRNPKKKRITMGMALCIQNMLPWHRRQQYISTSPTVYYKTRMRSLNVSGLKARSHCSDNENDNDNDAKRTHSIGWMSVCVFCVEQFNNRAMSIYSSTNSTNTMRSLCVVIVIVFVIAAVWLGLNVAPSKGRVTLIAAITKTIAITAQFHRAA